MKCVQIPEELFLEICDYFNGETELEQEIREKLDKKLDAMIARIIFTKYKKAPKGEERERLRKEYLKHRGMNEEWCSDEEAPYNKI